MVGIVKCGLLLCAVAAASSFSIQTNDVIFHLFVRGRPESEPLVASWESIATSSFSLQKPTIITIHNHFESAAGNFNAFVVPALLQRIDANVIAMDWSRGAPLYTIGLRNAPVAGEITSTFFNLLINQFGYTADQITVVGHGLGAHVAGIAGRNTNGEIDHIVALDPSLHGWTHNPDILAPNAARLVEVLYATAGDLGYDSPLGHLNFYANGGTSQPGCGGNSTCSHTFAYVFYAESIEAEQTNGPRFRGTRCEDYVEAMQGHCTGARDAVFGGVDAKTGSGVYSFSTNFVAPFARD